MHRGRRMAAERQAEKLKVFISYSRQDMAFVDRLQTALAERGIEAFVDRDHIEKSEDWWARLTQLITDSDTIVFALSPDSVSSKVCADEVAFGERLNKRFVPIVARDLVGQNVPSALARLNYVWFIANPQGKETGDFDDALAGLVRALETDIPWIREHTRLGALAERWEVRSRPSDLLLRGAELATAETWLTTRPEKAPDPTDAHRAFVTISRQTATRKQRWWVGGTTVVAMGAIGVASFALIQRTEAVNQRSFAVEQRKEADIQRDKAVTEAERANVEAMRAAISESQTRKITDQAQHTESGLLSYVAEPLTDNNLGKDSGAAVLISLEGLPDLNSDDTVRRQRKYASDAELQLDRAMRNLRE